MIGASLTGNQSMSDADASALACDPASPLAMRVAALCDSQGDLLAPLELGRAYEDALESMPAIADAVAGARGRRRRRRGIYYTPPRWTNEVVRLAMGAALAERRGDSNALLGLRILDPAMGCGAFLIAALDAIAESAAGSRGARDHELRRRIALTVLHGVDIDPDAAALARVALARSVGGGALAPAELAGNLRCGDALGLATPPATSAIDWCADFASILGCENAAWRWQGEVRESMPGFDVVIGNPPYLQEARGNALIFRRLRDSPFVAAGCERMTDLFHLFIWLSLCLLRHGGRLGMIVPEYWLSRTGAARVRAAIAERRLETLMLFGEDRLFADARGHHSSILIVQNAAPPAEGALAGARVFVCGGAPESAPQSPPPQTIVAAVDRFLVLGRDAAHLLERIASAGKLRLPRGSVANGLQSYPDRVGDRGVFVLDDAEMAALDLSPPEQALLLPYIQCHELAPFAVVAPGRYRVIYADRKGRALIEADEGGHYSRLRAHLLAHEASMTSHNRPFGLHRSRDARLFTDPRRLIMPRKTDRVVVAVALRVLAGDESMNFIVVPDAISLLGLHGILSSTLAEFFFFHVKRQGARMQIDTEVLLRLPLPAAIASANASSGGALEALEVAVIAARLAAAAKSATDLAASRVAIDAAVADLYELDARARCALVEFFRARAVAC